MKEQVSFSGPRLVSGSVWGAALFVIIVIAFQLFGSTARTIVYLSLGLWALNSPLGAIQALTLTWVTTYLNPGIFEGSELDLVLRWLVLICAALRVSVELTLRRDRGLTLPIFWLFLFAGFATAVSIARSYAVEISLLRVITFTVGAGTVLLCFQLARRERPYLERWFLGLFAVLVFGGLPLIGHDLGYLRNNRGFQGLLSHPQSYGAFLAPVAAWGTALLVVGRSSYRKLWIPLTFAAWLSLFASEARTALLGAVGGLIVGAILVLPRSAPLRRHLMSRLFRVRSIAIGIVALAGVILFGSELQAQLRAFVTKGQPEIPVTMVFERSRGALVAASWENFQEQPVLGMGFGLASEPWELAPSSVSGVPVPVGASVEKGFLPTALLEEVGLVGSAIFLLFILSILLPLVRSRNLVATILILSALLVNLGEAILFSLGGIGLYVWLIIGYGHNVRW